MLTDEQMAKLVEKANAEEKYHFSHPSGYSEEDVTIIHRPKVGAWKVQVSRVESIGPGFVSDEPVIYGYGLTLEEAYEACVNPKVPEWMKDEEG